MNRKGDSDCIVHVEAGLVRDPGAGIAQDLHLPGIHVHTVGQDALGAEDAGVVEALDHPLPAAAQAVFLVCDPLGCVDVKAGAQPLGRCHAIRQYLI